MQYEPELSRDELIELATKTYFGNVDAKNMDAALECFHDGALFGAYETIIHRDFTCTVDEAHGRIAASFVAELTDADGGVTLLNNTNFWRVRDGKFQEVYVYMSGTNVLV